jgi:hypothetical protein
MVTNSLTTDFGRISFPGTLLEALENDYKISEYHFDTENSVNVTGSKPDCIDVFIPKLP